MNVCVALLALLAQGEREGFDGERTQTEVYPGWEVVRDDQHSIWTDMSLVETPSPKNGVRFLRITTQGGNNSFQQVVRRAYEVSPERSYVFSGYVRIPPPGSSEKRRSNAAVIEVRWLGRKGELIRADRSAPVRDAKDWTLVSIETVSVPPEAAWAQLRLNFEGSDVRGECHFDDLSFLSQPRILVEPVGRDLPIYRPGERTEIRLRVPELAVSKASLRYLLRDSDGRAATGVKEVDLDEKRTHVALLTPPGGGYYELDVQLIADGAVVARKTSPVLVPERDYYEKKAGRILGVVYNPFHEKYRDIPQLTSFLGYQKAKIHIWDHAALRRSSPPSDAEILAIIRAAIEEEGVAFTAILARPPGTMFPLADGSSLSEAPVILFAQHKRIWEDGLRATVEKYGELLTSWQIGRDGDERVIQAGGADASIGAGGDAIRSISKIARVGIPAPASEVARLRFQNPRFYAVSTREWERPQDFAQPVSARDAHLTMDLRPRMSGIREQTADFLKKVIYSTTSGSPMTIYVPLSSDPLIGLLDSDGYPLAPALAFRVANDILSGATYEKDFRLFSAPIREFVYEKEGRTIVALWSEGGTVPIDAFFGYGARLVDPLGGSKLLEPGMSFDVREVPIFVIGADTLLLKTQLSIQLHRRPVREESPPLDATLPLRSDTPIRLLRLTNYFEEELTGVKMKILSPLPNGWTISPRETFVGKLPKNGVFQSELAITLPAYEVEGTRELVFEIEFDRLLPGQDKAKHFTMKVRRPVFLVSEVHVQEEIKRSDSDEYRMVSLKISNASGHTVSLRGTLQITGESAVDLSIGSLRDKDEENLGTYRVKVGSTIEILLEEKGGKRIFVNKRIPVR